MLPLSQTRVGPPACALCGGPLPAAAGPLDRYCCDGCAKVHEILAASGHRGDVRESVAWLAAARAGLVPVDGGSAHPVGAESATGERRTWNVGVEGLWCPSCAWLLEHVLGAAPGVERARVAFISDRLEVRYDPSRIGPEALGAVVAGLGYGVRPEGLSHRVERGLLLRFGLAAFLLANVMALSYALYAHRGSAVPEQVAGLLPYLLMGLSAPVVFGAGSEILHRAWRALRARALTMDSLIALGALSAWGYSAVAALRGSEEVYFDGACGLITFWLLGRLLEQAAFRRAAEAGSAVLRLLPRKARRLEAGGTTWVPAEQLVAGDRIRVAPGERVPVDARVLEGQGHVSTAVLDGEPRARRVGPGSEVPGGSSCGEAALDLLVVAPASDSLLARIAGHVALATGRGGEAAQVLDAVARLFVPFVLLLSLLCGAGWLAAGLPAAAAFERALTVLVVSCPCALGIAGPLARVLTAGALARRGILARDEGALDRLATARRVAFDKTGTLTEGSLVLVWRRALGLPVGEALARVRAAERSSGHPVAEALRRALPDDGERASDLEVVSGLGVRASIAGSPVRVGRCGWVQDEAGQPVPQTLLEALVAQETEGRSAVLAWLGPGRWLGMAFDDAPRAEAAATLQALHGLGLKTALLSGDTRATTARLAEALGIAEAHGDCLPEDKAAWLRAHEQQDGLRAIFVGDGINDAPAMAAAVGVAVASGTDFARETAAVLLLDGDLRALPELIATARRMRRVILQNLGWAALYNAVALPAALLGLLNPVLAAAAMVGSGLATTFSALRLRGDSAAVQRSDHPERAGSPEQLLPPDRRTARSAAG